MPRVYKKTTEREEYSAADMESAVKSMIDGKSQKAAPNEFIMSENFDS